MKRCLFIAVTALILMFAHQSTLGQQHPVKITFETPEGWKGETITLPPGFAKNMSVKGVEEIRFAPGMFKANAEDFFSYALVFWLPDRKPLDEKTMHAELLKYYRGLAAVVAEGRNRKVDPKQFKLKLTKDKKNAGQFTATLDWVEPFVTGKPQTLRMELKTGKVPNMDAAYLSMAVSPQSADHDIWPTLRKVLASAQFKARKNAK